MVTLKSEGRYGITAVWTRTALVLSLVLFGWNAWRAGSGAQAQAGRAELATKLKTLQAAMEELARESRHSLKARDATPVAERWDALFEAYHRRAPALEAGEAGAEASTDHLLRAYSYMNQAEEMRQSLLQSPFGEEERKGTEAEFRSVVNLATAEISRAIAQLEKEGGAWRLGEKQLWAALSSLLALLAAAALALHELKILRSRRGQRAPSRGEALAKSIVQASMDGIMTLDGRAIIRSFNPAAERIFGYGAEEVAGQTLFYLIPCTDRLPENGQGHLERHADREGDGGLRLRSPARRKGGSVFPLEMRLVRYYDEGEPMMLGIFREAAQPPVPQPEPEPEQAEKLAARVSLSFNQLLTAINGYCELVLDMVDAKDPISRELEHIRDAGERAAFLARQLQIFGGSRWTEPQKLDLNALIRRSEENLRSALGGEVETELLLEEELGAVRADPGQTEQVLWTLVTNARDAMPRGGRFTVKTESDGSGEEGRFVLLTVSDTGCGMDEETRARLFEPLFTTKPPGRGTGLGLFTAREIVSRNGGKVEVESEPGRGTTVRILLPRYREPAEASAGGAEAGHA